MCDQSVEWEVFLSDGTAMNSREHVWSDVPDSVIAVRWWDGPRKGINWGDSVYGHPSTWKGGKIIEDSRFKEIMDVAQSSIVRPSER